MSILEKTKINLLKKKIDLAKTIAHDKGKFSLFDTKFASDIFNKGTNYNYLESMYEIISNWEEFCNLPYNTGISLDKIASDNVVMCHRTQLGLNSNVTGLEYNENLFRIMKEGLKNYGHINAIGGSALSTTPPSLNFTMTPLTGISGYINLIGSYKSNDAIILSVFPKTYVKEDGEVIDQSNYADIYDLNDGIPSIKKEYMLGAVLKKNNSFDEFYTRDEIINAFTKRNSK